MEANSAFIYIEASSIQEPSFPVEIYWGTIPNKGSEGYLINPNGVERWANWGKDFFDVHGITMESLFIHGSHPVVACQAVEQFFAGKKVYAKDPPKMIRLLTELFLGADLSPITFELLELDELFLKIIKAKAKWGESPEVVLSQIKHRVAAQHPHYVCGGAFEALYYSEIWGLLYS